MLPLHLQKLLCVLTCARRVAHADRRSFCRGRASLAEPSYSTCLVRIRIRTHDHFPSTAARLNRFSFDTAGVRENRESSGPVPQSAPFDPRRAILFYSLWVFGAGLYLTWCTCSEADSAERVVIGRVAARDAYDRDWCLCLLFVAGGYALASAAVVNGVHSLTIHSSAPSAHRVV